MKIQIVVFVCYTLRLFIEDIKETTLGLDTTLTDKIDDTRNNHLTRLLWRLKPKHHLYLDLERYPEQDIPFTKGGKIKQAEYIYFVYDNNNKIKSNNALSLLQNSCRSFQIYIFV